MPASARLPERAVRWLPPVVAWGVASLVSWVAAHFSHVQYWSIAAREHWDSFNYLTIAGRGYFIHPCPERGPGTYCGNSAWFPGYPLLIRGVSKLGFSHDQAAVLIPEVALLALFLVLWWFLGARLTKVTGLTLALGAVFPGAIYFHAAFPMSLTALGFFLVLIGFRKSWWLLAAAGGFLAVLSHPTGQVVIPVLVLSAVFAWRSDRWWLRITKGVTAAAVSASSLLVTHEMMRRDTGKWDAYGIQNRTYFHQGSLRNPFTAYVHDMNYDFMSRYHPHLHHTWLVDHSVAAHQPQLLLNTAFVVLLGVAVLAKLLKDRTLAPEEWGAALLTGAVFVFPILGAVQSWYRTHALMFVALILAKYLPRWSLVPLVLLFAVQYVFLASMFFSNVLV